MGIVENNSFNQVHDFHLETLRIYMETVDFARAQEVPEKPILRICRMHYLLC